MSWYDEAKISWEKFKLKFNCEEIINNTEYHDNAYAYLADEIFDVLSYDDDIATEIGKEIYEVINVIKDKKFIQYTSENRENYKKYIIIISMLDKQYLINYGTSPRSAWFEFEDFPNLVENIFKVYNEILKQPKEG